MSSNLDDFQFWGVQVQKNGKHKIKPFAGIAHVSSVTLGPGKIQDGRTVVSVTANGKTAAIATLIPNHCENVRTDLVFTSSMKATISAKGPNAVSLTGYVQPIMDEDMFMTDALDAEAPELVNNAASAPEDEDEDAEMKPAAASPKDSSDSDKEDEKPAPKEAKKPAPKEKKKAANNKKRKFEEKKTPEGKADGQKKKKRKKKKKKPTPQKDEEKPSTEDVDENKEAPPSPKATPPPKKPTSPKEASSSKKKSKSKKKWTKASKGVEYRVVKKGKDGSKPIKKGTKGTFNYLGTLENGTVFDKDLEEGISFKIGEGSVIPGMEIGVMGMQIGEKRRIKIPSAQAYGDEGAGDGEIPPGADLSFTIMRKQ